MTTDRHDLIQESSRVQRRGLLSTLLLLLVCALILWWFMSKTFTRLEAVQAKAEQAGGVGADAEAALDDLVSELEETATRGGVSGENLVSKIRKLEARCPPHDGGDGVPPSCSETGPACPSPENPRQSFVVYFVFNNSELNPTKRETIARAAELVQRCSGSRVTVYGHADLFGHEEVNRVLSGQRAAAVATELGTLLGREVEAVALGESRPEVAVEGRYELNRRVEIVVE